jgi:predicted phage-related endonuclease
MIERIAIDPVKNRDAWLDYRRGFVTASDVPAVCGEGLFGSAAKVWADKKGLTPPQEMNDAMFRGIIGEPAVFRALQWHFPQWEIKPASVFLCDRESRLGATPDGAAVIPGREGVGIIQCKTVSRPWYEAHWLDDNDQAVVPLAYELQTLTEAMLADAPWAMIAVLIVDTFKWELKVFPVERNPGAEAKIRQCVLDFCRDYLDANVQPPIDPTRDADLVKRLFRRDDGTILDLRSDNAMPMFLDEREALKAEIKKKEDRVSELETEIKSKIGDALGFCVQGWKATWPVITVNHKPKEASVSQHRRLAVKRI